MNAQNNFDFEPEDSISQKPIAQAKILSSQPLNLSNNQFDFEPQEAIVEKNNNPQEKTNWEDITERGIRRSLSRAGETILGLPGDIQNLLKSAFQFGAEKLGGEKGKLFSEAISKAPSSGFPTSQDLRNFTKEQSQGYLEPQNEYENIADEFISDVSALAIPVKGKIPFLRSIGTAIAGNAAKQGAKSLDASETTQNALKIGTFFLAGLMRRENLNEFVSNLYKDAKSKIPPNTMIPTGSLVNRLAQTEVELKKGLTTTTKKEVLGKVKELKNKASGGAIPAEDLVQSYHDINESMLSKKLFEELNKTEQKLLRSRFDLLKNDVTKTIEDYGQYNPIFLNKWKDANQAFAAIQQSKKVSRIVGKALKAKPTLVTSPALALFEYANPTAIPATLAGAGIGYAGMRTGELIYQLSKSPALQKHYLNIIKDASVDNMTGVIKNLEAMDREFKRQNKNLPQSP